MLGRRQRTDLDAPWGVGAVERAAGPDLQGYWRDVEHVDAVRAAARTRRVPLRVATVTGCVGAGAWGATQLADVVVGPGAGTAVEVATIVGTTVSVPAVRAWLRASIPDVWARRWWTGTGAAAVWVDVVATRGPDLLQPTTALALAGALAVGTAAIGGRWFDEHEVRDDEPDDDAPEPVTQPIPVRAAPAALETGPAVDIEREWAVYVASGEAPVAPNALLVDRREVPNGWRWTVQLDRNKSVTCTDLEADKTGDAVAMKLAKRPTHVILERLPDEDDRNDRASFTVITRDILADGVDYRGPLYDRGAVWIGQHADGAGDARWHLYDNTGVLSGVASGEQGSGKSSLLAAIGLAARRSGEWVVAFGDGDENGNSSHLLGEVAHDYACGPRAVYQQLLAFEAWGRVRGDLMHVLTDGPDGRPTPMTRDGQRPVTKILPCERYPGLLWILDELYRLAQDPFLQSVNFFDRLEACVRFFRKHGGAVIAGTQSLLSDDFDGNAELRGLLAGGNVAAFRSKNKSNQGVVTDGVNMSALPRGGGYAFLGEGERRAMIRTAHPDGMAVWAAEVKQYGTPDARSWGAYRRYRPETVLDATAERAARLERLAALDAALADGSPLPGSPEAEQVAQAAPVDEAPVSIAGFTVPRLQLVRSETAPEPKPTVPAGPPLPAKQAAVLAPMQDRPGPWRTGELAERTGLSAPDVSKALRALVDRGVVRRGGARGVYEATAAAAALRDREGAM